MSAHANLLGMEGLSDSQRARMRLLLPVELQHSLESPADPDTLPRLHHHLTRLLAALRATTPVWLLDDLDRERNILAHGDDTTLLLADITDFTPITARLELLGRAGNDILIQVVNGFFDAMVAAAYRWGGDVLSFGGDALLVAFTGAQHSIRAAAAAIEMQQAIMMLPALPLPSLKFDHIKMKIGIAAGPLVRTSAGTHDWRVALALGDVLHTADRMAATTKAGYIRLDRQAASEVTRFAHLIADGDSYLLGDLTALPVAAETSLRRAKDMPIDGLIRAILQLSPYLPYDVLAELAASPNALPGDGELREVISVFVQIAGLNKISDALGVQCAAEIGAIATDALAPCFDAIERAGGVLARVDTYDDGHKLLALFGAPRAGERDAEWAVWAALRLREQLPAISAAVIRRARAAGAAPDALPDRLTLHAGINAGQVVTALIGSGVRYEYTIMGDSANVAARLMARADPLRSEVLIGPGVHEQLRETIDAVHHGAVTLKGKSEPTAIWEAHGIRPRSWRAPSSTPLVGRAAELAVLNAAAKALHDGRRGVVLIQGEAGVGKTRLRQALQDRLGDDTTYVIVYPPGRAAPVYGALRELLYAVCAIPADARPEQVRAGLRETLGAYGIGDDAALLVALEFLASAADEPYDLPGKDEAALRIAFAGLVHRLLLLVATRRPLALFVEDLHDLDGESLAVLEQIMLLGWDAPLLFCATLRPGAGQASAAQRVCDAAIERFGSDAQRLEVGQLDAASGGELLAALIPGLAPTTRVALLDHAGANPLFLELLAQRIEQQGALRPDPHGRGMMLSRPLNWLATPRTLSELVVAQLDMLPPAVRRTARAAAVLATAGRTFTQRLLEQITDEPAAGAARLDELVRAHVIVAVPSMEGSFSFRHPLFQSEAYRLLQSHERRELHRCAAFALDTYTDADDARSEMLAYHYRQGQVWDRTLFWSLDAGRRARRAYANERAYAHLRRSLWLARRSGALQQAAAARAELGALLSLTGRWEQARAQLTAALNVIQNAGGTPEQVEIQARCHRLLALVTERLAASDADYEEAEQHCRAGLALLGIGGPSIEVARLHAVHAEILERRGMYAAATQAGNDGLAALPDGPAAERERVRLLWRLATIAGQRGRYTEAIAGLEQCLSLISPEDAELRAATLDNLGVYLQQSGQLDRALERFTQSVEIQERISDIAGRMRSLNNLGMLFQMRGDYEQALHCFAEVRDICRRLNLQETLGTATTNVGFVHFLRGNLDGAAAEFEHALQIFQRLKLEAHPVDPLYRLGDVALARRDFKTAHTYGTEALTLAGRIGSAAYQSCALRVIGEALLGMGQLVEAAAYLETAYKQQIEVIRDPFDQTLIMAALARLAFAQGDQAAALRLLDEGLALARETQLPFQIGLLEALRQQLFIH